MKKTVFLLCMAALVGRAQPYGEKLYPHKLTFCSSGELTSVNTPNGFIMSGIVPGIPFGGFPNYYIDKTDEQGQFVNPGDVPFSNEYFLFGDQNCSGTPQIKTTFGSDVIEATAGSGIGGWYAQAITTEMGVFFSMLDPTGIPILVPGGFYPFPGGTQSATRPVIIESQNPMEYFITGSFQVNNIYYMYILNVSENGGPPLNTIIYVSPGNTSSLIAADMILSPYLPTGVNELAIVGKITDVFGSGSGDRGFLARVDVNTLLPVGGNFLNLYGQAPGAIGFDSFSCITEAASGSAGGNGFAIGGHSDANGAGSGLVWTLKVDPTGNTIYWNNLTQPVSDKNAPDMISIKERYSAVNSAYEYYGAVINAKGMNVLKLDDNGLPFISGNPVANYNEFLYYGPQAAPGIVRDLTVLDNGGPVDIGLQVYGTDDASAGGYHYFVQAAFNGYSAGCNNSFIITGATSQPGPPNAFIRDIFFLHGLQWCPNFTIKYQPKTVNPKILCDSQTLPSQGNNDRLMATTGIAAQHAADNALRVSPNPVSSKVEVTFTASDNSVVDIKLYDYLGRFVQAIPVLTQTGNTHVAGLDMTTLNIESGIYIIKTTIDGVSSQQKIIYTKGQ